MRNKSVVMIHNVLLFYLLRSDSLSHHKKKVEEVILVID